MRTLFYDDVLDESRDIPSSIFLAGPTAAGVPRTPWRAEAVRQLEAHRFDGTVILPEFRDGLFTEMAPIVFGATKKEERPIPSMRAVSYNILHWETIGIERSTLVLFWMPFHIAHKTDPSSLPGFTTRAEVSREIARNPKRIVLGMPDGAMSSAHIRFHAHRAGLPIMNTLEETIATACRRLSSVV